jgi:hypothetical protein
MDARGSEVLHTACDEDHDNHQEDDDNEKEVDEEIRSKRKEDVQRTSSFYFRVDTCF